MIASVLCTALPVFASETVTVNSGEELRAAVAAVADGETKTIKVGADFSIANNSSNGGNNESLVVAKGATVIIEGDNKTIDVMTDLCTAEGSITFKNLTLKLTTPMIGTAKGGSVTYEGCTITQTGGRSNNNKFGAINADGGSFTLTDTTLTIHNGTRNDTNSNVAIFKLEGQTTKGTVNLNNSHIKLADDAVYTKNVYAFYDSDSGSTLNINMVNSTIGVKNTALKSAGIVNLTMSGASSLTSADSVNVVEMLGGAETFTLKMSDTAEISNAETSEANVLQLDQAKAMNIEMSGDSKIVNNGSGFALCGHNGYDKTTRTFALTMSGNAKIYAKANHAINVQHDTYEKIPATTITMSGSSKIVTDTADKYALYLGAATSFTLNLSDSAALTKKDGVTEGAVYQIAPPESDVPADGKLCRIGNTYYASLEDAIKAAAENDTIVLEANAKVANTLEITKNVIIEGNGKTITSNGADGFVKLTAALTVNNAIVTTDNAIGDHRAMFVFVGSAGKVVMSDVTIALTNAGCKGNCAVFSDENVKPGVPFDIALHNVTIDTQTSAPNARFLAGNAGGALTLTGNTSIKMNGNTIINVSAVDEAFNVTMEDNALIETNNGNQVIYTHANVADASGKFIGTAKPFNLTMSDNAKIVQTKSGKNAIGLNNSQRPVSVANIILNDNSVIQAPGIAIRVYTATANITVYENADIAGETSDVAVGGVEGGKTMLPESVNIVTFGSETLKMDVGTLYAPVMADKPTMRINGTSYGLRFTSSFQKERSTVIKAAFGTLITKADTVANTEFSAAALTAANAKFIDIKAVDGIDSGVSGSFNAALVDVKEANHNTVFAARSYSEYTFVNDTHKNVKVTCYSDVCTGTYADAALAQLADIKDASETGYTNDVDAYPVLDAATGKYTWTEGKKYSKLNDAQYTAISAIAGKK
ncbi:MAG: hypothetical protein IJY08_03955 [Clostridia bacterium]|nr:hypothetical protein [Clostridia bacterium]